MKSGRSALLLSIISLSILFAYCGPPQAKAEMDGKTYTFSDLDERTQIELQREFNENVANALQRHVYEKMLEKAAAEKGMEKKDFLASLEGEATSPSDENVRMIYEQYKNHQDFQGKTFEESSAMIRRELESQSKRQNVNAAVQDLVKKYGLKIDPNLPDLPPADIAIDGDPIRGNKDAKVTIVEFSDFDCPYCMRIQPTAQKIRAKYGDRIKWVFKDFPLSQIHPAAMKHHIMANCVRKLNPDKYWDFFDAMFDHNRLDETRVEGGARKLALSMGVDGAKFDACMNDPEIKAEIDGDVEQGEDNGVRGTPSFYLDGEALTNLSPEEFEAKIAEKLN